MATSPKQNEILKLQSEITNEVNGDAKAIADGVFGDNKNHPDMAQVPNAQLDDLYRQKYQANDRQWLQAEARRDPNQFMDVAKRIGVTLPNPTAPPAPTLDHAALAQNLMANAAPAGPAPGLPPAPPVLPGSPAALPPPAALPAPMPAPVVASVPPPMAPPPVILGPNGQPLPPSGGPIPAMTGA